MSNETAQKKLTGHGKVICRICGKVITQCRCMKNCDTVYSDICDDCEEKERIMKTKCRYQGSEFVPCEGCRDSIESVNIILGHFKKIVREIIGMSGKWTCQHCGESLKQPVRDTPKKEFINEN